MTRRGFDQGVCVKRERYLPQGCLGKEALLHTKGFCGPSFLQQARPAKWPQELNVQISHNFIVSGKGTWVGFSKQQMSEGRASDTILSLNVKDV
jgi:hypothetical protein